ncbi:unnamed protein product [Toxocara canis]|uniref:ZP domain-containing protein n=1 Tax=Toxocara canis TaxID=6265 RepID=A0A183USA2_TOXCA|nr:unnamed protein product [Toxocara canis]
MTFAALVARQSFRAFIRKNASVLGEPTVECLKDNLRVNINTEKEFEGHVYVKGHYDEEQCRADATLTQHVNLTVPFSSCDVRRERSVGFSFPS